MQRIGELSMEVELLRSRIASARPFGPQEVAVMAAATSPSAGQRYGVARVCKIWGCPAPPSTRLSQPVSDHRAVGVDQPRRGPKPAVSDEALLAAIRADLTRSPWTGEGHRKVWARLRVINDIRVSRKRVLRRDARARPAVAAPRPQPRRRRRTTGTSSPRRRT